MRETEPPSGLRSYFPLPQATVVSAMTLDRDRACRTIDCVEKRALGPIHVHGRASRHTNAGGDRHGSTDEGGDQDNILLILAPRRYHRLLRDPWQV